MPRNAALLFIACLALAHPASAQDWDPHQLVATLPAPKPPWWLRGRYSIALAHAEDGETYRMELCPLRTSRQSRMSRAAFTREFVAIAKYICRPGHLQMHSKIDYVLLVSSGGRWIDNITGDFTCLPAEAPPQRAALPPS